MKLNWKKRAELNVVFFRCVTKSLTVVVAAVVNNKCLCSSHSSLVLRVLNIILQSILGGLPMIN